MFPAGSQLLYLGKQAFFPSFLSWIDLILLIYISILYDEIVGVSHIHVWMYVCIISILILFTLCDSCELTVLLMFEFISTWNIT